MVMGNRYDKYKDSGIAWIGEIPEHWNIGYVGKYLNEVSNRNTSQKETNTLQFKMGEIVSKSDGNSKYNPESIESYNIVYPDTIMINGLNLSFDFISQRVALVREQGAITSAYLAMKPNDNCSPNYITYLFKSYDYKKVFHALGKGLRATLNYNIIRNELIVLPSLSEQQSIATYLDQKCSEIDELITLQEEMITKLQSYKQSVITEAVTKGLDKNVPLKDSGIEWIGEIPEHWNICKLKNIFLLSTGTTPKDFDQTSEEDNLINWYTPSDILDSCNDLFSSQRKLSEKVIYANKISLFPIGTLLYVGIGASAGKVGYANENGYSNQQITGLIPLNCYSRFYFYYLSALKDKIRDNAFFTTLPIINNAYLGQELIPFPTIPEQQSIADYLDRKCSEIDELISIKQQKIEKLKDYKKSLIFECVTGKRKVS